MLDIICNVNLRADGSSLVMIKSMHDVKYELLYIVVFLFFKDLDLNPKRYVVDQHLLIYVYALYWSNFRLTCAIVNSSITFLIHILHMYTYEWGFFRMQLVL